MRNALHHNFQSIHTSMEAFLNLPFEWTKRAMQSANPPLIAVINHLLKNEKWARESIMKQAGKVACLDLEYTRLYWRALATGYFESVPVDGTNQKGSDQTVEASQSSSISYPIAVTVKIKASDIPFILQNTQQAISYVKIEGDADFAQVLSQLSQELRWDVESDLAQWVGDVAAVRMVQSVKAMRQRLQQHKQHFCETSAEYFLEENPTLVRPREVDQFGDQTAQLRDDVERLMKKIEKLEKRSN